MKNFRQVFRLTDKDDKIAELEKQVQRLTEQNKKLTEEKAAQIAENERLEKTWKFNYDLLLERVEKAEQEVGDLKDANSEIGLLHDELMAFLRTIKPGVFRSDRNGKECYKELQARIAKYDSQVLDK